MIPLIQLKGMQNQIFYFAQKNIKIRYRGTNLGLMWTALEPLLFFVFLYFVFTSIRIGVREDFGNQRFWRTAIPHVAQKAVLLTF